jgi:hypothetical protein
VVGAAVVGRGQVGALATAKHLDDRPAGALPERGHALGRFAAVELDQVGAERRRRVERGVVGVDQQRHADAPTRARSISVAACSVVSTRGLRGYRN